VEKRDNPALARPAGDRRRRHARRRLHLLLHRAHPRRALGHADVQGAEACPEAVVVRPRMAAYTEASRAIRAMMEALTPLVEPLSLDEAFLDLTGTERLHGASPAVTLARLRERMEEGGRLTVSVGLSTTSSSPRSPPTSTSRAASPSSARPRPRPS
jgi:DNA polymerase IV